MGGCGDVCEVRIQANGFPPKTSPAMNVLVAATGRIGLCLYSHLRRFFCTWFCLTSMASPGHPKGCSGDKQLHPQPGTGVVLLLSFN